MREREHARDREIDSEREEKKIHTPEAMANKYTDQISLTMGTAYPSQMKYPCQVVKGPVQLPFQILHSAKNVLNLCSTKVADQITAFIPEERDFFNLQIYLQSAKHLK